MAQLPFPTALGYAPLKWATGGFAQGLSLQQDKVDKEMEKLRQDIHHVPDNVLNLVESLKSDSAQEQAEAVAGLRNAFKISGNKKSSAAALSAVSPLVGLLEKSSSG